MNPPEAIATDIFNHSDWIATKHINNVVEAVTELFDKYRAIFFPESEATEERDIIAEIENVIESENVRSAWDRGVKVYALELIEELKEAVEGGYFDAEDVAAPKLLKRQLLNGASDWSAYSWGGSSLIYDRDIAERLCNPSELKKTRNGERRPNSREEWLDTQARALRRAANKVMSVARSISDSV